MTSSHPEVIIVGGGLAGLCCARRLHQNRIPFLLLEASDDIGGRVRTDHVEGFLLDRGFQVFQTAYPEARQVLDYEALKLHTFYPGALVRFRGRFHRVGDPWRRPQHIFQTLLSPIGTFADKLRLARLSRRVCAGSLADLYARPETSTLNLLKAEGFSEAMIEPFFRPFFSGVFFDRELATSSRMFEFVYRMLALGENAIPAQGIGAIPKQLAASLPPDALRTGATVQSISSGRVILSSGEELQARAVVVAANGPETTRLLGEAQDFPTCDTTCLYFTAHKPPVDEPVLLLDGEGRGPVTNMCVLSNVAPSYAPAGEALLQTTVVGNPASSDAELEKAVRHQLSEWFGTQVQNWRQVRTYRISRALPVQTPPVPDPALQPVRVRPGLYFAGEYRGASSIQWAMVSGRRAAEAVLDDLSHTES